MLGERDLEDLRAAIARLSFRVAKTMPQIPHQYTVRGEGAEADYVALHQAIRSDGVVEYWHARRVLRGVPLERSSRGVAKRYLYPGDGFRYWYESALPRSKIINRNRVEDAERLRAEGLISSDDNRPDHRGSRG
jgi:hypothetical protein